MKTKICNKCKIEKPLSEFNKDKSRKDGLCTRCNACRKIEGILYRKNNKEKVKQTLRKHYINKLKQKRKYDRHYTEYQQKYKEDHVEQILLNADRARKKKALFDIYNDKLKVFEEIRRNLKNQKLIEGKCAYCGKWIVLTNLQIRHRIQAFKGKASGEARFYCSENCKQSCPIFNQKKWPKGFKKATSREVVPLLRQLVLERDDYTCQKCGATTETAQLHVHHEKSYIFNKIMANDPDNCITLCKSCHKKIHSQEGCNYNDLKCKEGT